MGQQKKSNSSKSSHQSHGSKANTEKNQPKHGSKRHKDGKNWQESTEFKAHLKEFNDELAEFNMTIRDVQGDGNCLFRSISDQLEGSEIMHMHYRNLAVDELKRNQGFYKNFIFDQEFSAYLEEIAQNHTWGGNLEIQALSQALGHNFIIHMKQKPFLVVKGKRVKGIVKKTLHLAFHNETEGEEHYSSIRNQKDIASSSDEPATPIEHQKFRLLELAINQADEEEAARKEKEQLLKEEEKELEESEMQEQNNISKADKAKNDKGKSKQQIKAEQKLKKAEDKKSNSIASKKSSASQKQIKQTIVEEPLEKNDPIEDINSKVNELSIEKSESSSSDVKILGRNQKCHCGSLKPYKKCCIGKDNSKYVISQETQKREAIFI